MKHFFSLVLLLIPTFVFSQELRVTDFSELSNDLSASIYSRVDNNDVPCSLVKVQCISPNIKFSGNTIGDISFKDSEYWVYLAKGSKRLKIMADGCLPIQMEFSEYGILKLESKTTYLIKLVIERKEVEKNWRPLVKRKCISAGVLFPSINVSSSGTLTSVVDYGVSDMEDLRELEEPFYVTSPGFFIAYERQIPLYSRFFLRVGAELSYLSYTNSFKNTDLIYELSNTRYYLDYSNKETYQLSYFSVPLSLGFSYPLSKDFSLSLDAGALISLGLVGNCLFDGFSNYTVAGKNVESTISGSYGLFSGEYEIDQEYTSGRDDSFSYYGTTDEAPYTRTGITGLIGIGLNYKRVELGIKYRLGLTNMGNPDYWDNSEGGRVCGLLLWGNPISSTEAVKSYVQKCNSISVALTYKF